jgi:hypothetical protein
MSRNSVSTALVQTAKLFFFCSTISTIWARPSSFWSLRTHEVMASQVWNTEHGKRNTETRKHGTRNTVTEHGTRNTEHGQFWVLRGAEHGTQEVQRGGDTSDTLYRILSLYRIQHRYTESKRCINFPLCQDEWVVLLPGVSQDPGYCAHGSVYDCLTPRALHLASAKEHHLPSEGLSYRTKAAIRGLGPSVSVSAWAPVRSGNPDWLPDSAGRVAGSPRTCDLEHAVARAH